jgi:hypothetical protein
MAERRLFGESVMSNVVEIDSAARSAHVSANPVRDPQWGHYEPFVDEHVVASFLGIEPRRVLEMARKRLIPTHPIGCQRKTWRFRISEIDAHFSIRSEKKGPATIGLAVLGTQERKRIG